MTLLTTKRKDGTLGDLSQVHEDMNDLVRGFLGPSWNWPR